jgi:hypothetical protein
MFDLVSDFINFPINNIGSLTFLKKIGSLKQHQYQ